MRALVTGAAGFIGSRLAARLVAEGLDVVGVDAFTATYPRAEKVAHLAEVVAHPRFVLVEADLTSAPLDPLLDGVDVVFHQAAEPGVRKSWGQDFGPYLSNNVLATQRLCEALRAGASRKLVYASSSSVYGDTDALPITEATPTRPHSPYGVTKLAGEHLVEVYRQNFGLPFVSLRYFTVYGPHQRPDMGLHRFFEAALDDAPITVFGDGGQSRDFTHVDDVVEANVLAARVPGAAGVYNVGGGSRVTVGEVLDTIEELLGRPVRRETAPEQPGDVRHTAADTTRARTELGFAPRVALRDGLAAQLSWHRARRAR